MANTAAPLAHLDKFRNSEDCERRWGGAQAMFGVKYPKAQFLITSVLGPYSNAHGLNEFLDIEYGRS